MSIVCDLEADVSKLRHLGIYPLRPNTDLSSIYYGHMTDLIFQLRDPMTLTLILQNPTLCVELHDLLILLYKPDLTNNWKYQMIERQLVSQFYGSTDNKLIISNGYVWNTHIWLSFGYDGIIHPAITIQNYLTSCRFKTQPFNDHTLIKVYRHKSLWKQEHQF